MIFRDCFLREDKIVCVFKDNSTTKGDTVSKVTVILLGSEDPLVFSNVPEKEYDNFIRKLETFCIGR